MIVLSKINYLVVFVRNQIFLAKKRSFMTGNVNQAGSPGVNLAVPQAGQSPNASVQGVGQPAGKVPAPIQDKEGGTPARVLKNNLTTDELKGMKSCTVVSLDSSGNERTDKICVASYKPTKPADAPPCVMLPLRYTVVLEDKTTRTIDSVFKTNILFLVGGSDEERAQYTQKIALAKKLAIAQLASFGTTEEEQGKLKITKINTEVVNAAAKAEFLSATKVSSSESPTFSAKDYKIDQWGEINNHWWKINKKEVEKGFMTPPLTLLKTWNTADKIFENMPRIWKKDTAKSEIYCSETLGFEPCKVNVEQAIDALEKNQDVGEAKHTATQALSTIGKDEYKQKLLDDEKKAAKAQLDALKALREKIDEAKANKDEAIKSATESVDNATKEQTTVNDELKTAQDELAKATDDTDKPAAQAKVDKLVAKQHRAEEDVEEAQARKKQADAIKIDEEKYKEFSKIYAEVYKHLGAAELVAEAAKLQREGLTEIRQGLDKWRTELTPGNQPENAISKIIKGLGAEFQKFPTLPTILTPQPVVVPAAASPAPSAAQPVQQQPVPPAAPPVQPQPAAAPLPPGQLPVQKP